MSTQNPTPSLPSLVELQTLANQIDSALEAATGIATFAGIVTPVYQHLITIKTAIENMEREPRASDLSPEDQGENGSYTPSFGREKREAS